MEFSEVKSFRAIPEFLTSGDFKMVKVRKGKRGRQNPHSLVFRISRSSVKPLSDDSGINCYSTEEQQISRKGEKICTKTDSLKIKIPLSLLNCETERNKVSYPIKAVSSKYVSLQSDNHGCQRQQNVISCAEKKLSGINKVSFNNYANNLHSEPISSSTDGDNLSANKDILISIPEQTTRRIHSTNTTDIRRSSQRILLRVLKHSESDPLDEKRKRGRKPGTRVSDCKKRKYCRRGRPPKYACSKPLGIIKSITSDKKQNEKVVLFTPPKNSVWTLVPKELLESEFFKTQIQKIQLRNIPKKIEQKNLDMPSPISFLPSVIQMSSEINGNIQFQTSEVATRNVPAIRQFVPETGYTKRPTVINLKSERQKFDNAQIQRRDLCNPQIFGNKELSENQNDLQLLYNNARMLKEIILKNYYDIEPVCEDVDTLSRNIIVQSLQVLFSEEAVLA